MTSAPLQGKCLEISIEQAAAGSNAGSIVLPLHEARLGSRMKAGVTGKVR